MSSISRRAFTLGSLSLASLSLTRVASADPIDDVIVRVGRARAALKTLVGSFTQERTIGLLAASVKSTGTVTLVRPDRLRWELAPPDDVVYWITPEGLAYRSKTGQGHVQASQSKLAASLDDLRTLLGGDLAKLKARYELRLLSDSKGELAFDAVPRDSSMPLKALRFGLGEDGAVPRYAELVEGARDKTRIDFGTLARDIPVDPALVRAPV